MNELDTLFNPISNEVAAALPSEHDEYEKGYRDALESALLAMMPLVDKKKMHHTSPLSIIRTALDAYGNNRS